MRKALLLSFIVLVSASCATTSLSRAEREQQRILEAAHRRAVVAKTIESGSFVLRFENARSQAGRPAQLASSQNYIAVHDGSAEISLAYSGRQYGTRPIAAFIINGKVSDYRLEEDASGTPHRIRFSILVDDSGAATAVVNNNKIDMTEYSGYLHLQ